MKKVILRFNLQMIYRKHIDYAMQIINDKSIKLISFVAVPTHEEEDEDDKEFNNVETIIFEISYSGEIDLAKKCVSISSAFNGVACEEHGEGGEACYLDGLA